MGNKIAKIALWHDPENRRCAYCRKQLTFKTATVDHRTPLGRGGANRLTNTVLACFVCNNAKGNKTDKEYANG